ncbi:BMC domain-containing protein [Tessaracoccus massiliensis]|uniref:BMC domain-containing protein n=1 Tax=Tessaracoccus massiliensis TaxID=1522311 RepID=UPI0006940BFF|nr:BMC domain-containing protein [Tessaracoccus massiliensis]
MEALGTVEVVGLVAGVEAADVACKTADVRLVGYELAKGGGYVTIKVLGQVGAVHAAVAAAAEAAARISRVVSKLVIPRPSDQIEAMVFNTMTVGHEPEPEPTPERAGEEAPAPATPANTTTRRKQS